MSHNPLLDTPWKVSNELKRRLAYPVARLYFAAHGVEWSQGWRIYGRPLIQRHRGSVIAIDDFLQMRNWLGSNPLTPHHRTVLSTRSAEARLTLGHHVGMTGATIVCEHEITIGNHVRLGANSTVVDTDFHPLSVAERRATPLSGKTRHVIIEDDVFIGMSSIILKGTHIESGSVVGAGSVVSGHVPPGVIVAGNPAVIIRELV